MLPILLLHIFISILFSSLVYIKDKSLNYTMTAFIISLGLPFFGIILFLEIRFRFLKNNIRQRESFIQEPSNREYFKQLDMLDETNVVSIEESLLISDIEQRRETMMKTLKKDDLNYFKLISNAVKNDDPETSHYAASSMLNKRRVLDIKMRAMEEKYQENPDDRSIAMKYFDIIDNYIRIFDLDAEIMEKYLDESISILKKIIDNRSQAPQKYVVKLIELLISKDCQKEAKKYCKKLISDYSDNEEKYVELLKSYYAMKDKNNFDITLKSFIDSEVIFSNEVLEIIRFWIT